MRFCLVKENTVPKKLTVRAAFFLLFATGPTIPAHAVLSWFSWANCGITLPYIPWLGIYMNESVSWNQLDEIDRWLITSTVHN